MQIDTFVAVAASGAADLLRDVPEGTHGAPTPCAEWNVRELIDHIARVGAALELSGRGEPVPAELWTGPVAAFDAGAVTKAWIAPPAVVRMGDMDMPGPLAGSMLAADLVLHGWDLARATGQEPEWPADLLGFVFDEVAKTAGQGREMGVYGPPVGVPDTAPVLHRILGLTGRDPSWRPGQTRPEPA
jgi:uncharacterized protein (TIGR03086 family)